MADASCTPLISKSVINFSLFLPHKNISSNPLFPFPSLSFSHSKLSKRPTNKRKQIHLTCFCTPNSPDFDVISTHERLDGSLVFRFGDPSEVVNTDQLSETNSANEEPEGEDNNGYSVVNVLDGDHKREVIVKKIDRNVKSYDLVEVVDEANLVSVSSGSNYVFEKENSLTEMSSSTSSEVELPVSVSVVEENDTSGSVAEVNYVESTQLNGASGSSSIDVEMLVSRSTVERNDSSGSISQTVDVEHVEESIELKDSSRSVVEVEDVVHVEEQEINDSSESVVEVKGVVKGEEINDSYESVVEVKGVVTAEEKEKNDSSESVAEVKDVVQVEEKEINDSSESVVEERDVVRVEEEEIYDSSESVVEVENVIHVEEESPIEGVADESLSALETPAITLISGPENRGASLETQEPVIGDTSLHESASVKLDTCEQVINDDVHQETSQENAEVVHSSTNADALNVESGNQNEIIGETVESDVTGVMPPSPSETKPILDGEEGLSTTLESEVEPILDEEEALPTMEYNETRVSKNTTTINDSSKSVLEVERTKEMVQSDDELVEASSSEVLELNSTGSDLQSEDITVGKLFISSGASLLPHPQKVLTGGKDAYFTCQNWLGVADGVGRWSLEGINHGGYSKELMENCRKIVSECNDAPITAPKEVLNQAVAKADSPGASTVLIAHFDGEALHVANIGDSGFIILRSNTILQRSSPMMHEFNFPVLIEHGDDPSKFIESYKIYLVEGDVVVVGTDGLFDNLYEQEIASIVSYSLEADTKPEEIAEILAMIAQEIGSSTSTRTPFADAAQAAGCGGYNGGKLDDVAVIVSLVNKDSNSPAL